MAAPLPRFQPASELPASPSREEQLEAFIKTQAAALERYEAMLDSQPQQQAGGRKVSEIPDMGLDEELY